MNCIDIMQNIKLLETTLKMEMKFVLKLDKKQFLEMLTEIDFQIAFIPSFYKALTTRIKTLDYLHRRESGLIL
jgi:hypothetical protein